MKASTEQNHHTIAPRLPGAGRVTRSQGGAVCAEGQDVAKGTSYPKGDGSPEHLAIDLVPFLDAKYQVQSTVDLSLCKERVNGDPAAGELCSYSV